MPNEKTIQMTMQSADILEIKDEVFALEGGIFEPFFKAHPERRPKQVITSSNLWRKYIAYIALENNELNVHKMVVPDFNTDEAGFIKDKITKTVNLSEVFLKEGENKLSFFSGILVLYYYPSSKYNRAQRSSFPLKFHSKEKPETYKILEFDKGFLMHTRICNLEEIKAFKERQFHEFKKTEEYSKMLNQMLDFYANRKKSKTVFDRESFDVGIYHSILKYAKKIL